MNENFDDRALHFACSVGVDYEIAYLVTKRISRKTKVTLPNGFELRGNAAVYEILNSLYNLKGEGKTFHYFPESTANEKKEYLKFFAPAEDLSHFSDNKISELYTRFKISSVVANVFPKEINVKTLEKSELEALVGWLFSKSLVPLRFTIESTV